MLNRLRRSPLRRSGRSTTGATVICLRGSGTTSGWLPVDYALFSTAGSGVTLTCLCRKCQGKAAGDLVVDRFMTSLRKLAARCSPS